jgi:hypothetical protein
MHTYMRFIGTYYNYIHKFLVYIYIYIYILYNMHVYSTTPYTMVESYKYFQTLSPPPCL